MELPEKFIDSVKDIIPDFEEYLSSLDGEYKRAFRFIEPRFDKALTDEMEKYIEKKVPYSDNSFLFSCDGVGNLPCHHSGGIYVQEPSAMAPVEFLPFVPDAPILDCCSAPGGKSIQLYQKAKGKNLLVSNEFSNERLLTLSQNLERCGVKKSIITNFSGEEIGNVLPQIFGTVLVDAPCSGEGMFRKSSSAVENWSFSEVRSLAALQKKILKSAAMCVLPGGFLIYSTCTFSKEENEEVVADFLTNCTEFEIVCPKKEISEYSCPGISLPEYPDIDFSFCRRFYPHKSLGEGQFAVLFRKKGEFSEPQLKFPDIKLSKEGKKIAEAFLIETLGKIPDDAVISEEKDGIYLVPKMFPLKKGVFAKGVKVGTLQKGRIVPHHRFFMAYGNEFLNIVDISSFPEYAKKYLSGEEIPFPAKKGFVAVKYKGGILGGGKSSDSVIKNHYPKGLRLR